MWWDYACQGAHHFNRDGQFVRMALLGNLFGPARCQHTVGPGRQVTIDIVQMLGDVSVPTLVIHCVGDSVAPLSEGKLLASRIPGAKFVTLNSRSHMVFENEPEWPRLLNSVCDFLKSK